MVKRDSCDSISQLSPMSISNNKTIKIEKKVNALFLKKKRLEHWIAWSDRDYELAMKRDSYMCVKSSPPVLMDWVFLLTINCSYNDGRSRVCFICSARVDAREQEKSICTRCRAAHELKCIIRRIVWASGEALQLHVNQIRIFAQFQP